MHCWEVIKNLIHCIDANLSDLGWLRFGRLHWSTFCILGVYFFFLFYHTRRLLRWLRGLRINYPQTLKILRAPLPCTYYIVCLTTNAKLTYTIHQLNEYDTAILHFAKPPRTAIWVYPIATREIRIDYTRSLVIYTWTLSIHPMKRPSTNNTTP